MPDIVITEFVDEAAVADLATDYAVVYDPELVDKPDEMTPLLSDALALIVRNRTQVTEALLETAPNLKVVGRLGVGLDNIDLAACEARGIAVCPATGANTVAVAEYVIATMLVLLRGSAYAANDSMVAGNWPRLESVGREASGRQLGLVGLGAIAREVAKRAAALDMSVTAYDPFLAEDDDAWRLAQRIELDALFASSDVVTLHVPLDEGTRHLVDAGRIDRMKRDAIVINAARGGVVDEQAVTSALRHGRLGGAALDVFETEPLDAGKGALFANTPNLILTPHIAGITDEANIRTGAVTVANVRSILER